MKCHLQYHPLHFIRPAGTSRGVMNVKHCWILTIEDKQKEGKGEISIIEDLSKEYTTHEKFEKRIEEFLGKVEILKPTFENLLEKIPDLISFPSILFSIEAALLDLQNGGKQLYFDNSFSKGTQSIPINGLIWMGDSDFMAQQIEQKLSDGYSTIKMKIGASNLAAEMQLLKSIRNRYSKEQITLRVDANGAFSFRQATTVLEQLANLDVHSIEQPIAAGNWKEMRALCENTPTPIALDEELIGVYSNAKKVDLLNSIQPQYIILKPSLHGGISGTREWIHLAEDRNIAWWMTSALESNLGLNVIAQFTAEYPISIAQGLGTGSLFENNLESSLFIKNGELFSAPI